MYTRNVRTPETHHNHFSTETWFTNTIIHLLFSHLPLLSHGLLSLTAYTQTMLYPHCFTLLSPSILKYLTQAFIFTSLCHFKLSLLPLSSSSLSLLPLLLRLTDSLTVHFLRNCIFVCLLKLAVDGGGRRRSRMMICRG